jgi:hypothetical protein
VEEVVIITYVKCDDCGAEIEFIEGSMRAALQEWYIGPGKQYCPTCAAKPVSPDGKPEIGRTIQA